MYNTTVSNKLLLLTKISEPVWVFSWFFVTLASLTHVTKAGTTGDFLTIFRAKLKYYISVIFYGA